MRVFDFRCSVCGGVFEAFVNSADDQPACPQCGAPATRQAISQIAIRTGKNRRGRVVDLSSHSCPCGGHRHARG